MSAETAKWCGSGSPIVIQSISKEGPISNIKDEPDRSEDDPERLKGSEQ